MKLLRFLRLSVIIGPLPANIINGQLADAGPVMANYNWIVNQVNANAQQFGSYNTGGGAIANNTAYGQAALVANTTGVFNTAIGAQTLSASTTGVQNTAIGAGAMQFFTGLNVGLNTAVGYLACQQLTNGTQNVGVGYLACGTATIGTQNVAVGALALASATASQCVAIGAGALQDNTNGANQVAVGFQAIQSPTTTQGNTAVGYQSMQNVGNAANDNVAVGEFTLSQSTTAGNVALGGFVMSAMNVGGGGNVAIGFGAMRFTTGGTNEVCVGIGAGQNVTGASNVFVGNNAGTSGVAVTTGDHNTLIGDTAQANGQYTNGTALGSAAILTASNTIVLGNSSIAFIRAQVTTINTLSDARHKQDVEDLALGLGFVNALRPVSFRLDTSPDVKHYGFIAQEVQEALDGSPDHALTENTMGKGENLALLTRENNEEGTYLLGYNELFAVLVNAIQQLTARIEELEEPTRRRK